MTRITVDGKKIDVRTHCDFAYVLQSDDDGAVVKIGQSWHPSNRLKQIAQSVPFSMRIIATLTDGQRREREMKQALSEFKLKGEWYRPNELLNEYLGRAHKDRALVTHLTVDEKYADDFIKPVIVQHLEGREAKFNEGGDFVCRYFQHGFRAIHGRIGRLLTAVPLAITPELVAGYVPLPFDAPCPRVRLPGDPAIPAAPAEQDAA